MSSPEERQEILARASKIHTHGEAREYIVEVEKRLAAEKTNLLIADAAISDLSDARNGASFAVHLSQVNDTSRFVTGWTVEFRAREGDWTGRITSTDSSRILQTPGLSGELDVVVVASGPNLPERQIAPQPGSRVDVSCSSSGRSVVGIVASPRGDRARYWTDSDAYVR